SNPRSQSRGRADKAPAGVFPPERFESQGRQRVGRAPVKLAPARNSWVVAVLLVVGCQPAAPLGRSGIELTPPASWQRVEPSAWMVPGEPLAAWSGPEGSSLVVYRT